MAMTYYLYDHPNPNAPVRDNGIRFFGYPQRSKPIRYIVMHTPEVLPQVGIDLSAEKVANYFATTTRSASAHVMIDSDTTVSLLPPAAVAFHVINYNTEGYGIECGWRAIDWGQSPAWDALVIERVAQHIVNTPALAGIPTVRLTKSSIDAGLSGFVSHASLDPERRTDPGTMFPWDLLFERINELKGTNEMTWSKPGDYIANLTDANLALSSQGSIAGATPFEATYNPGTTDEMNDRIWITLARIVDMLMQFDLRFQAAGTLIDGNRDDIVALAEAVESLETSVPLSAVWDAISLRSLEGHKHNVIVSVT